MLPWISWRMFIFGTATPGNGGPLLQPRGQTSVLYKVPPPLQQQQPQQPQAAAQPPQEQQQGTAPGGKDDGAARQ